MFRMYVSNVCFQSTYYPFLFPIYFLCFQSAFFVSNLITMFPMFFFFVSTLIFMFPIDFYVSNLYCFQCMFPIYILPSRVVQTKAKIPLDSTLSFMCRCFFLSRNSIFTIIMNHLFSRCTVQSCFWFRFNFLFFLIFFIVIIIVLKFC